jgi:acyl dehydratase
MQSDAITQLGRGLSFEEFTLGRRFVTVRRTILDPDICSFVNLTHMNEVLFTDMEHAHRESAMQGRVVPGALIYCFAEGLCITDTLQHTGLAFLGMEMKVLGPVFANDTIHVELEVTEARRSASRPDRGLIRTHNRVFSQNGSEVLSYTPLRMVRCRSVDSAAPSVTGSKPSAKDQPLGGAL